MNIIGYPLHLSVTFGPGSMLAAPDPEPLFWYWQGASGTRYIHTIFAIENCPALPGAVYIAVRKRGDHREALGAGRLDSVKHFRLGDARLPEGTSEIHVHMLAQSDVRANEILGDIQRAFGNPNR
jgi:hypothetical protein